MLTKDEFYEKLKMERWAYFQIIWNGNQRIYRVTNIKIGEAQEEGVVQLGNGNDVYCVGRGVWYGYYRKGLIFFDKQRFKFNDLMYVIDYKALIIRAEKVDIIGRSEKDEYYYSHTSHRYCFSTFDGAHRTLINYKLVKGLA